MKFFYDYRKILSRETDTIPAVNLDESIADLAKNGNRIAKAVKQGAHYFSTVTKQHPDLTFKEIADYVLALEISPESMREPESRLRSAVGERVVESLHVYLNHDEVDPRVKHTITEGLVAVEKKNK